MKIILATVLFVDLLLCIASSVSAESVGEVDTVFKWFGPDHKIVVDAYDDPAVAGSPAMCRARRPVA